jgi:hypothetical protein
LVIGDKGFICHKCRPKGDLLKLIEVAGDITFPSAVAWLEGETGIGPPDRRKKRYIVIRAGPRKTIPGASWRDVSAVSRKAAGPLSDLGTSAVPHENSTPPTYEEIGVTYKLASEAQTLAELPKEDQEKVKSGKVSKSAVEHDDSTPYEAFLTACRPVGGRALDWLTKDKGIAPEVVIALGLRFCGREYPDIIKALTIRFGEDALRVAGLLKRSTSNPARLDMSQRIIDTPHGRADTILRARFTPSRHTAALKQRLNRLTVEGVRYDERPL